jgi:5-methylcytosine-specific restriction endonuclease McrA
MTSQLRTMIKQRDNYTCRYCSISLAAEPHLLLEVDHIVPVSKGGLTASDNLQTLCWKCNRTKSNKIITS